MIETIHCQRSCGELLPINLIFRLVYKINFLTKPPINNINKNIGDHTKVSKLSALNLHMTCLWQKSVKSKILKSISGFAHIQPLDWVESIFKKWVFVPWFNLENELN